MKSILISIKPKYVAKILNGEKTIEIRKTCPAIFKGWGKNDSFKYGCGIDVYIYCTKDNKQRLYPVALLDKSNQVFKRAYREDRIDNRTNYLNGKVVAKFTLNKVEEISKTERHDAEILKKSCLTAEEFYDYLLNKPTHNETIGYAWHISNLVIFDRPKVLWEFDKCILCEDASHDDIVHIHQRFKSTKAPQSWCYVEAEE